MLLLCYTLSFQNVSNWEGLHWLNFSHKPRKSAFQNVTDENQKISRVIYCKYRIFSKLLGIENPTELTVIEELILFENCNISPSD